MFHPLKVIPEWLHPWLFVALAGVTTWLFFKLSKYDRILTAGGTGGMVAFERSPLRTLESWGGADAKHAAARQSLRLDFWFILLYSTTFAFGCMFAADWCRGREGAFWSGLAFCLFWLSLAQWLGGWLDVVENVSLLKILDLAQEPTPDWKAWPAVATVSAVLKFLIVLPGCAIAFVALPGTVWRMMAVVAK